MMTDEPRLSLDDMRATTERYIHEFADEDDVARGDYFAAWDSIEKWAERVGFEEDVCTYGVKSVVSQGVACLVAGQEVRGVLIGIYLSGLTAGWYGRELLDGKRQVGKAKPEDAADAG